MPNRRIPPLVVLAFAAVLSSAMAQQGPGGGGGQGGPPGLSQQQREAMQKYRPVFDLMGTVNLMLEVDKQKGLGFTKAQAKLALPVLKDLAGRANLPPKDAEKILATLEDKILSEQQVAWMDDARLKREEERRKRFQQQGGNTQGGPSIRVPGAGGIGGGRPGGGQGGPGGGRGEMFRAIMDGKPFNPFKTGPGADDIKTLTALIQKRADSAS